AKKCRVHWQLSQEEVAEAVGIKQPNYLKFEKGRTLNPRFLDKLAKIFKVDEAYLRYGINPPSWMNEKKSTPGRIPVRAVNDTDESLNEYLSFNNPNLYALKVQGYSMVSPMEPKLSY